VTPNPTIDYSNAIVHTPSSRGLLDGVVELDGNVILMTVDDREPLFLIRPLSAPLIRRVDAFVIGLILADGDLPFGDLEAI